MPRIRSGGPVTQFSVLPAPAYKPPRSIVIHPSDMDEDYWYFEWLENKDYVRSEYLKTDKQVMLAKIQIAKARLRGVDVPSPTPSVVTHSDKANDEALATQSEPEDDRERESVQQPSLAGSEQNHDNEDDGVASLSSIGTCQEESNSDTKRSVEDNCDIPPAKRVCKHTPVGTPPLEQPEVTRTETEIEHVPTAPPEVIGLGGGSSTSGEARCGATDGMGITANCDPMVLGEDHTFIQPEGPYNTRMGEEAGDRAQIGKGQTERQDSIDSTEWPAEGHKHRENNSACASHPVRTPSPYCDGRPPPRSRTPSPYCDGPPPPRSATTRGSTPPCEPEPVPAPNTQTPPPLASTQEAFSSDPPPGGGPSPAHPPSPGYTYSNAPGPGRESRANDDYIEEREGLLRQLELLRMRFRDARIPANIDRDASITNGEIKRVVARNVQHLRRNRNIATYKLGMVGSLLLMELFFARFCRIDMSRFMKWHYSNMQSYEELLVDLGEVSTPLTDASGGVQLMVLLVFNTFLFIANELLVKFFSIDVLHVMASITGAADIGGGLDTNNDSNNSSARASPQQTTTTPNFTQNFCRHFAK